MYLDEQKVDQESQKDEQKNPKKLGMKSFCWGNCVLFEVEGDIFFLDGFCCSKKDLLFQENREITSLGNISLKHFLEV